MAVADAMADDDEVFEYESDDAEADAMVVADDTDLANLAADAEFLSFMEFKPFVLPNANVSTDSMTDEEFLALFLQ